MPLFCREGYGLKMPNLDKMPEFRLINAVLSKLKTSFSSTVHALDFRKWQPLSGRL